MTRITRETIRETDAEDKGRKLVVQLHPRTLSIWPKGTRAPVFVSYESVYDLGRKRRGR
jgi:hypothetical protein